MTNNIPDTKKSKICLQDLKSHCKTVTSSKIFIAAFFTLIGAGGAVLANSSKESNSHKYSERWRDFPVTHSAIFHNDPFFDDYGLFSEIRHMQQRMDRAFASHHRYIDNMFRKGLDDDLNISKASISKKEDEKNYYYSLNFSGFSKDDIVVSVKDNLLNFSAKKENDLNKKDSKSYTSSDFYYSVFVSNRDKNIEPEIIRNDGEILVKIAKKS